MKDFNGAIYNMEAGKFKRNNGIVLRAIVSLMRSLYFTEKNLFDAVGAYKLSEPEVLEALDYLEGCSYIETRTRNEKISVRLADFTIDLDLVEFKLAPKGKCVAMGIVQDDGIEL